MRSALKNCFTTFQNVVTGQYEVKIQEISQDTINLVTRGDNEVFPS